MGWGGGVGRVIVANPSRCVRAFSISDRRRRRRRLLFSVASDVAFNLPDTTSYSKLPLAGAGAGAVVCAGARLNCAHNISFTSSANLRSSLMCPRFARFIRIEIFRRRS